MSTKTIYKVALMSASAVALMSFVQAAHAQDANLEIAASELPPIVVEGTTVAPTAATRKKIQTQETPIPVPANRGSVPSQTGTPKRAGQSAAASEGTPGDLDLENEASGGIEYVAPGRILQNQGTSTTVLTAEDLNRQQIRHAADALRSLPGVSVSRSGGPQSLTSVRIRGAESNHTLVLIDGVEVNQSDAAFDFSNLTTEDIEQVEVLRGPQSALYSSGALGGVINIRTKSGKGPATVTVRGEIGTQNSQNGAISLSGGNDNLHGIFTAAGMRTDGYNLSLQGNEDDGAEFTNLSFAGGVQVLPGLKLDMSLRRSENKGDRDDFDFKNIRPDGFEGLADTDSAFESVLTVGRIAATLDTFDGKWVHQWQIGGSESDLTDCCGFAGTSNFNIERMNYSYRSTATIDTPENPMVTHYLTGLVDHQTQKFQQSDDFANSAFDLERTGVAAELRGEYFRSLFLSAAVRHDQNDSFENYTTWQTSASYRLPGSIFRLHGAAGSGVKYPSLLELYGEFGPGGFTGNPNLKPEESIGWDGGIETTLFGGRAIVDVTYFNQKLENEIFTSFSPAYTVNNKLGESTREGIEFTGRFAVAAGLDLGLSYTYLRARESDNPAGTEEIRRPPHSGRIDVNYRFLDNRANINLAAAYIGDRFDQNFNYNTFSQQALALDSYWLLTLGASYLVTPNMEVYGRVENLLDQKYTEIIGIDSAPIAAYVGVKIKYDDPKSFGSSNN